MFFYNGVFPFVADARYCSVAVVPLIRAYQSLAGFLDVWKIWG